MGMLYSAFPASTTRLTKRAYCQAMKISSTGQVSLRHSVLSCASWLSGGLKERTGTSKLSGFPGPKTVQGTYGIAALCTDLPGEIVAARKASPLILGVGDAEY